MAVQECQLKDDTLTQKTPDVVFVRPEQARKVLKSPQHAKIIGMVSEQIDRIVRGLVACVSPQEFEKARQDVFSDYAHLSFTIANLVALSSEESVRPQAIKQSFEAVREIFQKKLAHSFGEDTAREAFFCLDTLRRTYRLVDKLRSQQLPQDKKDADHELSGKYNFSVLWAQFHLDCIRLILSQHHRHTKNIIDEILQGARLSVMAYSYARQGLELRTVRAPYETADLRDEEDIELLAESYQDYVEYESKDADVS
jgi:hypothetical protein